MAKLSDAAMKRLGAKAPERKPSSSAWDDCVNEAWDAVKADNKAGFSRALRHAITVAGSEEEPAAEE